MNSGPSGAKNAFFAVWGPFQKENGENGDGEGPRIATDPSLSAEGPQIEQFSPRKTHF